jgi:acyl dehydratase
MNTAAEGKVYPAVRLVIEPSRVEAFARTVGQDEPGVPPTFATVAEFASFPNVIADPELDLDFSRVLHTEQSYEWLRPIQIGETLTIVTRIESIRVRGESGFVTILTELRGADGEPAAVARSTMLERAG